MSAVLGESVTQNLDLNLQNLILPFILSRSCSCSNEEDFSR